MGEIGFETGAVDERATGATRRGLLKWAAIAALANAALLGGVGQVAARPKAAPGRAQSTPGNGSGANDGGTDGGSADDGGTDGGSAGEDETADGDETTDGVDCAQEDEHEGENETCDPAAGGGAAGRAGGTADRPALLGPSKGRVRRKVKGRGKRK